MHLVHSPRPVSYTHLDVYKRQAQRIEWETKGAYYVADFHEDNFEKEAWFTKDGVWQMTETDLRYADLPAPVRSSYESSTCLLYTSWVQSWF